MFTVLVVLAAATIAAFVVQLAVTSASTQRERFAVEQAADLADATSARTLADLAQDPTLPYRQVLADELPRLCTADLVAYPDPIGPGEAWPASCGSVWAYAGPGAVPTAARLDLPGPERSTATATFAAATSNRTAGHEVTLLIGGQNRPLVWSGGPLDPDAFSPAGSTLVSGGTVYAVGTVAADLSGSLVASETGFSGTPVDGAVLAGPASSGSTVAVRDVFSQPLVAETLASSYAALREVACLDSTPSNVGQWSSSLCLRADGAAVTVDGNVVTLPSGENRYRTFLIVPAASPGAVTVYGSTSDYGSSPPLDVASWGAPIGTFNLPGSGIVATDATTVVGLCDAGNGACRAWNDGPGWRVDRSLTVLAGTLDDPADLVVGGPVTAGDGALGLFSSRRVIVAASAGTGDLAVDAWFAALGQPGAATLTSSGTSNGDVRLTGAFLFSDFTVDLSGFDSASLATVSDPSTAPPLFPSPSLTLAQVARVELAADEIATMIDPNARYPQTIRVSGLPERLGLFDGPATFTARASSKLAVDAASTTPAVCTVAGSDVSAVAYGTCSLTFTQAGNGSWEAASTSVTLEVSEAQAITFAQPASVVAGEEATALVASASSGLPVSFTTSTPLTCSVSGTTLTPVAAGSCVVTARQTGGVDGTGVRWAAAPEVTRTVTVRSAAVPGQVTGLTVSLVAGSSTALDLEWTAAPGQEVTGYKVYLVNPVSGLDELVTTTGSTSYRKTGLSAGITYSFKVMAFNGSGDGDVSSTVSGTPIAAPDAPTIGSTSRGDLSVTMNFTVAASAAKPVNGIKIYRDGVFVTTLASSATSYQFTGLVNGQSYVFGAAASNAVGDSSTSTTTVTARTTPSAPTGLAVALVSGSSTSLDLSWNAVTNTGITGYAVYQLNGAVYELVTNTASTTYRVTGLTAGTTYSFKVAAYNDVTEGAQSSAASGTPATAPDAPTLGTITAGDQQLSVAFTAGSDNGSSITTYEYSTNNGSTWTQRASGTTASPIVITGLTNGTTYTVRIRAVNAVGSGTQSSSGTGTPATTPAAPTIGTITPSSGQLSVAFTAGADNGSSITNYEYSTNDGGTWTTRSPVSTASPIVITGLTNGTTYTVRIRAVNAVGSGTQSSSGTGTPIAAPDAPTIGSTSRGDLSVTMNFTVSSTSAKPVTGIKVYKDGALVTTLASSATSYQFTGLTNNTSYVFGAAASNAVGDSATATTMVTARTVPSAPTGLAAAPVAGTSTALDLSWNAVTNTGITGYAVYQLNTVSGLYEFVTNNATTTYRRTGLTAGTTYSFKVAAYNDVVEGAQSSAASGTPIAAPDAPTIGSTSRGDLSVTMNFTVSSTAAKPVTGIKVYKDGVLVTTLASSATSYQFTGLTNGQSYVFGAAASNAVGDSSTSTTTVTARTTPSAPTGLAVALVSGSSTSLDLSWNAVTNTGITGYAVYQLNGAVYELVTNTASTTYRVTGLTAGTTYSFKVAAYNDVIEGAQSTAASGTPIAAPDAPTIGSTSRGDLSVTMNFTVSSTAAKPVTGIKVYKDGVLVTTLASSATSYQFTGLVNGQSYVFGAATTNAVGDSSTSTTTVTAQTTPSAPTGLAVARVSGSSTSLDLSWNAVTNTGLTGYAVYQLNTVSSLYEFVANNATTSYRVTGLTAGTTYTFRVAAYNDVSIGGQSTSASGTPATAPAAPTLGAITAGDQQLSVAFTAGSDNGSAITNYEYSTDNGSTWATRSPASTASPIVITTTSGASPAALVNGTSYTVRIRAVNAVGSGTQSPSGTGTPVGTPVTVDFLVVAGGGGGGGALSVANGGGGGGGAGGLRTSVGTSGGGAAAESALTLTTGISYTLTVGTGGAGGTGGASAVAGTSGTNSVLATVTATGGGGGGPASDFSAGSNGGSGGGAGGTASGNGGTGTANQGFKGGDNTGSKVAGRGGGGAAAAGANGSSNSTGMPGGAGLSNSITGTSTVYAAGGAGGAQTSAAAGGAGGSSGVGGNGAGTLDATPGLAETGSGGGGGTRSATASLNNGAAGADGVVVVRIPSTHTLSFTGTGYTYEAITSVPGFTIYRITGGTGTVQVRSGGTATSTATPPAAPTITGITASAGTSLSVAFTAGSDNGSTITNYEYSTDNGVTWVARTPASTASPIVIPGAGNGTTYVPLTAGVLYDVRIRAVNGLGSGAASSLTAAPSTATPGGAVYDLVYCRYTTDCSGLTVAVTANQAYQFAFSATSGKTYLLQAVTVDSTSTSWMTGSTVTYANVTFATSSAGATISSNGTSNWYLSATTSTVKTIQATGTGLNDKAVFFRIAEISNPTTTVDRPIGTISNYVYTDVVGVYTTVQTTSFRAPADGTLDFLVIGGGGGGGAPSATVQYYGGGGGGAGGYRTSVTGATSGRGTSAESKVTVSAGSVYTVTVGSGGPSYGSGVAGANLGADGGNGGNSVFGSITATGGGGGGAGGRAGLSGGAGGGAGGCGPRSGGAGTSAQGYDGGSNTGCPTGNEHRGGGGAGSSTTTHTGGSGLASSITGTAVTRAAGGIGGGTGGSYANSGAANSGNGGGGTQPGTIAVAGTGGSGIVIIRVQRVSGSAATAPTIGTVTASSGQLSVAFTAPASDGGATITNYEYSTNGGSTWTTRSPAATTSPIVITGLDNGTTYSVRIRAVTSAGSGTQSNAVSGTPVGLPGAPTIGSITGSDSQLSVAFTAPASDGGAAITNYQFSTDNGATWATRSPASALSPLLITGLVNNTTYTVRIRAVNSAGSGTQSASSTGTPGGPPAAPTIGTVTASSGQLSVAFTAPASDGGATITNYEYSTNGGSTWTTRSPAATTSPIVITGLDNNTFYSVSLRAVNSIGPGTASSASAPTLTTPTGAADDLVYCQLAAHCSGLGTAIGIDDAYQFSYTAVAGAFYRLDAYTIDNTSTSWSTGTRITSNVTFTGQANGTVTSRAGSGDGAFAYQTATANGTSVIRANGSGLSNKTIFFRVTSVSNPASTTQPYTALTSPADTDVLGVYTTAGTTSFRAPAAGTLDYLVIAGGGSGGMGSSAAFGGSGGAGGYRTSVTGATSGGGSSAESKLSVAAGTSYTVTVGQGGGALTGTAGAAGNNGLNSVLGASITASGGGTGAGTTSGQKATQGGSGGGGAYGNTTGNGGLAGQGYAGGDYNTGGAAGYGGGAGGAATTTVTGAGLANTITGTSVTRGVGGLSAGATAPAANSGSGGHGGRLVVNGGPLATNGANGLVVIRRQRA